MMVMTDRHLRELKETAKERELTDAELKTIDGILTEKEQEDILRFRNAMCAKLREKAQVRYSRKIFGPEITRRDWDDPDFIPISRIWDELKELMFAETDEQKMEELVDIANFCMMAWCNLKRKQEAPDADDTEGD
jgi:hypothetical protein